MNNGGSESQDDEPPGAGVAFREDGVEEPNDEAFVFGGGPGGNNGDGVDLLVLRLVSASSPPSDSSTESSSHRLPPFRPTTTTSPSDPSETSETSSSQLSMITGSSFFLFAFFCGGSITGFVDTAGGEVGGMGASLSSDIDNSENF